MVNANGATSEQVEEDLSLLQQPLQTAFVEFQEARRAFEDGTDEVRHLLLHECSLIYECNVCRNLFRSLANFISHKRAFCSRSVGFAGFPKRFSDDNSAIIVQGSDVGNTKASSNSRSSPSVEAKAAKATTSTKDLCQVIERLKREKGSKDNEGKETVLHLERVPTSSNAVYQTIKHFQNDSIRTEVNEVYNLLNNKYTEVGPDGKAVTQHKYAEERSIAIVEQSHESLGKLFCDTCNLGFQTEKTLQMHKQKKHISTTFVYLCPECSSTYLKPAHVMRHLVKDHSKSRRRVKNMREAIIRKKIKQCDAPPVKTQNRELKRLQMGPDAVKEKSDNADNASAEVLPKCTFCGETFKRNAALASHKAHCPQKKDEQCKTSMKTQSTAMAKRNELKTETKMVEKDPASVLSDLFANLEMPKYAMSLKTVSLERLEMSDLSNSENSNLSSDSNASRCCNVSTKSDDNDQSLDAGIENNSLLSNTNNVNVNEGHIFKQENFQEEYNEEFLQNPGAEEAHKSPVPAEIKTEPIDPIDNETELINPFVSEQAEVPILKVKRKRVSEKLTACLCKICKKKFNTISNAKRHISMFHYRAKYFKCDLCEYNSFRKYDVTNHLVYAHELMESREDLVKSYVKAYDTSYSKKDIDSTILVMPEEDAEIEKSPKPKVSPIKIIKTFEKKKKKKSLKQLTLSGKTSTPTSSPIPLVEENFNVSLSIKEEPSTKDDVVEPKLTRSSTKKEKSMSSPCSKKKVVVASPSSEERPTRKRNKTMNNDFVYAPIKHSKKESPSDKELSRAQKKKLSSAAEDQKIVAKKSKEKVFSEEEARKSLWDPYDESIFERVKGSSELIAMQMWREGRAALGRLPTLPAERPQLREKLTPNYRNIKQAGPVIDSEDLEAARLNASLLEDAFLEKFTRHSNGSSSTFKVKPCLESPQKTLNSFLESLQNKTLAKSREFSKLAEAKMENGTDTDSISQKVKESQTEVDVKIASLQFNGDRMEASDDLADNFRSFEKDQTKETENLKFLEETERTDFETKPLNILNTDLLESAQSNDSSANNESVSNEFFPRRRFTLMQHLAEGKQRKKESLLRSALEKPQ